MDYSKLNLSFFLLPLVTLLTLVVGEPQVPCLFIFGDSLVDNGNNIHRNTTAKVNFLPYGIDFPDGPTGRFTNGRNVADIIAELLGFDSFIPPFANVTNEDILRGANYGSGGAGILDETGRSMHGDIISLNEQLSNHEAAITRITKLLGGKTAAKQHLGECIYYVVMGNNDYLGTYLPHFYSSKTPYTPQQFAALLIEQYSKQLRRLYESGARKIAVSSLGKLGCVPLELATYGSDDDASCVETGNNAVQIFNENLKHLVADLNNRLPDAKFVYTRESSSATSYGNIKNLRDTCCLVETGGCVPGSVPCGNRFEYMFWDEVHPTEAGNLISATIAYNSMAPLYASNPIDVW
ncbi:Triacylglycerol lipase [Handroanthus impetiginosus]|uniref:Triacylglycerol lipase n=1 Tax=Handroanthus impetiginosus TaxID=429701 RepID=A0A2G9GGC7_9LAMI|nr:Triacylglycerol lipase [Handroanthus impetiginosus]